MTRFREKPAVFEGVQWSGSNWHSVLDFAGKGNVTTDGKDLFLHMGGEPQLVPVGNWLLKDEKRSDTGIIVSLTDEDLRLDWHEIAE